MVAVLMMSAKLATLSLLKIRYFEIKVMTSYIPSMVSPATFYYVTQIVL